MFGCVFVDNQRFWLVNTSSLKAKLVPSPWPFHHVRCAKAAEWFCEWQCSICEWQVGLVGGQMQILEGEVVGEGFAWSDPKNSIEQNLKVTPVRKEKSSSKLNLRFLGSILVFGGCICHLFLGGLTETSASRWLNNSDGSSLFNLYFDVIWSN